MALVRIVIPAQVDKLLNLAGQIAAKHSADKNDSLLKNLSDHNWDELADKVQYAATKHQEAEELRRKMEEAYKERDRHLPEITEGVKATRDMLKGAFMKNPRKLGDWRFTVNDAAKPGPKTVAAKVKA